jgi:flagellar protein FlaG
MGKIRKSRKNTNIYSINLNAIDGDTGYHIVRVTNPETGEVVRQLPSEEMLRLAHSLTQISALVNQKA